MPGPISSSWAGAAAAELAARFRMPAVATDGVPDDDGCAGVGAADLSRGTAAEPEVARSLKQMTHIGSCSLPVVKLLRVLAGGAPQLQIVM